ncbi:MAG: NFACT family protein, partial [Promethearchaeota archaeon]
MYRNYFLFKKQTEFLNSAIIGSTIHDCFTHRKDELVIKVSKDSVHFIRIGLEIHRPYILLYPAPNIKEPQTHFFSDIVDQKINDINIIPFDKIIYIELITHTIICKFFGRIPNVILINKNKDVLGTFKKDVNTTIAIDKTGPSEPFYPEKLKTINRNLDDVHLHSFLKTNIGGLNNLLIDELCYQNNKKREVMIHDMTEIEWAHFIDSVDQMFIEFKKKPVYIYEHSIRKPILSLVELNHLSSEYKTNQFDNVNTAWKQFIYKFRQTNTLAATVDQNRKLIHKRIEYLESTLKKITDFAQLEKDKKLSELKGNLLLTFASDIEAGTKSVSLKNVFSPHEENVEIKLNPRLSVYENAEKYFSKYKNIDDKKSNLKLKTDTYKKDLDFWKKLYAESEHINTPKKAENLERLLITKNLLQKKGKLKKTSTLDISDFNRLLVDNKWEILIGKNAKNNDLLTFKFARK